MRKSNSKGKSLKAKKACKRHIADSKNQKNICKYVYHARKGRKSGGHLGGAGNKLEE